MEEEKAAAYYDDLTRRGEGAARFKQGLGFSSTASVSDNGPARGSAMPSSSSFLSSFVRASSPSKSANFEKQAQIQSLQNKLKKKPLEEGKGEEKRSRVSERSDRELGRRHRSRSSSRERDRERFRERHSRRRSRSRDRYRDREREMRRRRSLSPRERRSSEKSRSNGGDRNRMEKRVGKEKERNCGGAVDYSRLIEGYDKMSPAERVKAKMKLQLAKAAEKDATKGMGPGWERFEFNKDAPLDDEEMEVAEDDAALVKRIGKSFRFSAVEARREEQIKAAHDEAMFGAPALPLSTVDSKLEEENNKETNDSSPVTSLLSEKVLSKQQGSWRDRARKVQDGSIS